MTGTKLEGTRMKVTRENTGGRPPKLDKNAEENVVRYFNNGITQKEIAEKYGVSLSTVRRIIRKWRLET